MWRILRCSDRLTTVSRVKLFCARGNRSLRLRGRNNHRGVSRNRLSLLGTLPRTYKTQDSPRLPPNRAQPLACVHDKSKFRTRPFIHSRLGSPRPPCPCGHVRRALETLNQVSTAGAEEMWEMTGRIVVPPVTSCSTEQIDVKTKLILFLTTKLKSNLKKRPCSLPSCEGSK